MLFAVIARRRAAGDDAVLMLLLEQATRTAARPTTATCATSSWRCSRGHDTSAAALAWGSSGSRGTRSTAPRDGDPAYLDAVVKEVLRIRRR